MPVDYHKSSNEATHWGFVLAGFACLVSSAYYDIIRGPLLPVIDDELQLEFTGSGWFFAAGNFGAALTTILLIWALNRWSERRVSITTAVLAAVVGCLALAVTDVAVLMIFAVGIGVSTSLLGTMSNVLVLEGAPPAHKSRFLSALHSMYGLGSASAAGIVGWALGSGWHWSRLFMLAIPVFVVVLIFAVWRMPGRGARISAPQPAGLSRLQMLAVWVFSLYVVGEVTTSFWMTTYLVRIRGMDVSDASYVLTAYFAVLMVARIITSFTVTPAREPLVLIVALSLPVVTLTLGLLGWTWGFVLTGLFGPFFPVYLARLSRKFPENWRSLLVWTISVMSLLIGVANLTLSRLADWLGLQSAFWLPPALLGAATVSLLIYLHPERQLPAKTLARNGNLPPE